MSRPYSVRFMSGRGANRLETYTVPAGKRAVVRHVLMQVFQPASHELYFRVHGIPLLSLLSQVPGTTEHWDVRFTAYERETIQVWVIGIDGAYAVDGFLFDDLAGTEPDDSDNVITPVTLAQPHLEDHGTE